MEAFRGAADRNQSSGESPRGVGLRNILVVAEIGLAMMLLVSSALLMKSFWALSSVELGYQPRNVLTFQVSLPAHRYSDSQLKTFTESLTSRLRAISTVQAAGYANQLPMVNLRNSAGIFKTPDPDRPPSPLAADVRLISGDYLNVMGIRVVSGRGFQQQDRDGSQRVLLINRAAAARDFPGQNPVGQFVYVGRDTNPWQIAGVVEDVRQFSLDKEPTPQIFATVRQWSWPGVPVFPAGAYYAVRTEGDPAALAATARAIARELDPQAALFNIAPMETVVATTVARPRMYAVLLAVFAAVGLVLALLGVYSVMAYSVVQRTREIGIRMSLGAERRSVVGLVLWHSSAVTSAGIILGSLGAAALSGFLEGLLFGMSALDPTTFTITAAGFAATATMAAFVPARRATKIDPLVALRFE